MLDTKLMSSFFRMVRTYHRKTNRQSWNAEQMANAIEEVTTNGMKLKAAAKFFQVPLMSLKRRVRNKNLIAKQNIKHLGSKITIFTPDQENQLVQHILNFETRMYGLTTIDVRRLAFQLAERNNIFHNFSREKQMAGLDWLAGFRKRHPDLSLRVPESTSAARARAFNKPVVSKFFGLLKELFQKYNFPPHRVFNVDETSVSTVPGKNSKTFAKKGRKQVARVTSAERGVSATAVICTSAGGVFVPPMIIFSRKRMKPELKDGAPPGTIFGCNESGWMKLDMFEQWFDHFLHITKPSKEEPILLILDGHLTHTKNLNVLNKAKENNVIILCLPPHTTHKLQPLDVGVMYPFNTFMDQALEKWMNNNPGRIVTTFQISRIFSEAYLKSSVPNNAINGFRKTGIVPLDPDVFSDADYVAAEVTEEEPYEASCETQQKTPERDIQAVSSTSPIPGPSTRPDCPYFNITDEIESKEVNKNLSFTVTPADCQALPKIKGKRAVHKRKSVGSVVLTSTPYKSMLEDEVKKKTEQKLNKKNQKDKVSKAVKSKNKSKQMEDETSRSEDSDSEECIFCCGTHSAIGEGWIRCTKCLKWAHDECAGVDENDTNFICDFCLQEKSPKYRRVKKSLCLY